MDKRYQVFVSSTYTDLQEVRGEIFKTLMSLDCIPAGMETFPAMDMEQFEFIKTVIDDCDYYLLIVGGRYGSISPTGLSYTELEYDYAVGKGMKVIAFLHSDIGNLPSRDTESDPAVRVKLQAFQEKVRTGRNVKFWKSAGELNTLVATSVMQTIRVYPAVGWVRADRVTSEDALSELNELRKQLAKAQEELQSWNTPTGIDIPDLAGLDDVVQLRLLAHTNPGPYVEMRKMAADVTPSWRTIFAKISPIIQMSNSINGAFSELSEMLWPPHIRDEFHVFGMSQEDAGRVRVQLVALGLVHIGPQPGSPPDSSTVGITLTERGHRAMLEVNAARTTVYG